MDYDEAQDYIPSNDEIDKLIRQHRADPDEFRAEIASGYLEYVHTPITGGDVLAWLGY